jgi:hypothetical protein
MKNLIHAQHEFWVSLRVLNDFDWKMGSHLDFERASMRQRDLCSSCVSQEEGNPMPMRTSLKKLNTEKILYYTKRRVPGLNSVQSQRKKWDNSFWGQYCCNCCPLIRILDGTCNVCSVVKNTDR